MILKPFIFLIAHLHLIIIKKIIVTSTLISYQGVWCFMVTASTYIAFSGISPHTWSETSWSANSISLWFQNEALYCFNKLLVQDCPSSKLCFQSCSPVLSVIDFLLLKNHNHNAISANYTFYWDSPGSPNPAIRIHKRDPPKGATLRNL